MAQCVLRVSDNPRMPDGTGLRHRSALGIAEQSDVVSVVVSEQTGSLSIAHDSILEYNLNPGLFEKKLNRLFHLDQKED